VAHMVDGGLCGWGEAGEALVHAVIGIPVIRSSLRANAPLGHSKSGRGGISCGAGRRQDAAVILVDVLGGEMLMRSLAADLSGVDAPAP
jgi:hypothetical protein